MDDNSYPAFHRKQQRRTSSLEDLLLRQNQQQQQQQKQQLTLLHNRELRASGNIRRNVSSPVVEDSGSLRGGCSPAAKKLGRYVDEEVYSAFSSIVPDVDNRRRCIGHVIKRLDEEILCSAKVRSDLQAYQLDLCGFLWPKDGETSGEDGDAARRMLGNLEYRVATLRDRLLYPLHYQQLIDLSHLCGCIHAVRMRLGFVGAAKQQQVEAAPKEKLT
ncbi:hypothetical protein BOX15_Mlig015209g1 [Macrostomum lignano]|uniref:Uncharacterized protein n=1 Tax=Macrostomum lignano TaxID=282301 RepID=A0A267G977_9PLAT|nr:hypothetical protein BOX15_Mlig015209g1 [Macrostomum lignano]